MKIMIPLFIFNLLFLFVFGFINNNYLEIILLSIDLMAIEFLICNFLIFFYQQIKIHIKLTKTDTKKDFDYYDTLLQKLTISEIGYINKGTKNYNDCIIATLINLKEKNIIKIKSNKIKINFKNQIRTLEKKIIENYKTIFFDNEKKEYIKSLKNELLEKKLLTKFENKNSPYFVKIIFIFLFSFIIGLKFRTEALLTLYLIVFLIMLFLAIAHCILEYIEIFYKTQEYLEIKKNLQKLKIILDNIDETNLQKTIKELKHFDIYTIILKTKKVTNITIEKYNNMSKFVQNK